MSPAVGDDNPDPCTGSSLDLMHEADSALVRVFWERFDASRRCIGGIDTCVRQERPVLHAEQEPWNPPDNLVALVSYALDETWIERVFSSEAERFLIRQNLLE